jgi:hypothetical protein
LAKDERGLPIEINRKTPPVEHLPFKDYFKGFEKVQAVRSIFGEETDAVLENLKVEFISPRFMYMGIKDEDGSIIIGTYHLRHSDLRTLYLDIVHELFHIKQWQQDREYFGREHQKFMGNRSLYYASPIEVPAYKHTVREAEKIGMSRDEIVEHLKMGPTPPKVFARFLKEMEIGRGRGSTHRAVPPVRINRKASVPLFPFTDYFKGFEKVPAVRALLGERAGEALGQLKVEFVHNSFMRVVPSDGDGHLLVSVPFLKSSDPTSIYLEVLVCLNLVKRASEEVKTSRPPQEGFGDSTALVESYKAMLQEARRLRVPHAGVMEHLNLPRFMMSPVGHQRFLRKLGLVKPNKRPSKC